MPLEPGADPVTGLDAGAAGSGAAATAGAGSEAASDAEAGTAPVEADVPVADTVAETSETIVEAATETAAGAEPAADAGAGADAATGTTETAADAAASAETASSEPAAEQLAAIPEAPRLPDSVQDSQSFGVAFGGSRVVIVARMESFLRVRDETGTEIWSRLLRSGDRYLVPERGGLTLSVGNAGGIDIFVDGTKAPALGAVGVGVTGISLDPERLKSGTALP
jgi:cytoskeleton protein RodZ